MSTDANPYYPGEYPSLPYGYPNTDACTAKRSFAYHIENYFLPARSKEEPTQQETTAAVEKVGDLFSAHRTWVGDAEVDWFEAQFTKALLELDPNSIPGHCFLAQYGSTNREALKIEHDDHGNRYFDVQRLEMLRFAVKDRWNKLLDSPEADPIKVFVKREPHKTSKLEAGRVRLIQAVSLVDTMVDRILFGSLLRTAVKPLNILKTPCVVGWTPMLGGWRYIQHKYPRGSVSIDRSAWDWTVTEWLVRCWSQIIKDLHPGAPKWWLSRVDARFELLFHTATLKFSDGVEIAQKYPGIMKSGCLLTLYLNSLSQIILHVVAMQRLNLPITLSLPLCAGDDTLQEDFPQIEDYCRELNTMCITKEVVRTHGFSEFVGFIFYPDGWKPSYWQKHLFNLIHLDVGVQAEAILSYQMLWYKDPIMLSLIRHFAANIDPHLILPDRELIRIANGE